jgi:hypothetical protein
MAFDVGTTRTLTCVYLASRIRAQLILARALSSNKSRIHLRRLVSSPSAFSCSQTVNHTYSAKWKANHWKISKHKRVYGYESALGEQNYRACRSSVAPLLGTVDMRFVTSVGITPRQNSLSLRCNRCRNHANVAVAFTTSAAVDMVK